MLPNLKNVPFVNVSYFPALKEYLALPGHTEYSSTIKELKIEDFYVNRTTIRGRDHFLIEDSLDGEDELIGPPSETLADDSFTDIQPSSSRMNRLPRQNRNKHAAALEYSSSVPETEFNLTRKPIENSAEDGTLHDWKPTSPPRQSTQKNVHRGRRLSPLPDIEYSAIREPSQPSSPIVDDLEEQVHEQNASGEPLPYLEDSPEPPERSYSDNDDILSNPSIIPKKQNRDIFENLKPIETYEPKPSLNFKRQNSAETGNSPKRVKMELQIENAISKNESRKSIRNNDISRDEISIFKTFPSLNIFTSGNFLSEDRLIEPDENNCWFLTEEKETFTKLKDDYKPPESIPLFFFNLKTEELTEEVIQ